MGKHSKLDLEDYGLIILMLILILSMAMILLLRINSLQNRQDNIKLRQFMASQNIENNIENNNENIDENIDESIDENIGENIDENIVENIPVETSVDIKTDRMIKLEELQKENSDIKAWLEIINSDISYPVLQGKDNSYYMTHNYKKQYSSEGSLFLDKDYNWNLPSTNLLIYGHNNRGTNVMFCGLMNYKKENYYNTHKKIRFTTINEDAEYEILSVFLSKVYYASEQNAFRYYYFINANNKEEFDEYVEKSKEASLYDTGINAEYGEQLMTLSTCEFSQKDGRLAIVAKKVNILSKT